MDKLIRDGKKEARRASKRERRGQQENPISPERSAKKVKLTKLTAISGVKPGTDVSNVQCFRCAKKGHRAKDCPNGGPKGRSS